MITLDSSRCTGCGQCARICHESCITLVEQHPQIDHQVCSTCTQCIALCPQQALSWDQSPAQAYDTTRLPSSDQLDELFKERRSIRAFKAERIERAVLEEVIRCGTDAPTHNFAFRLIVADEPDLIAKLDKTVFDFNRAIYQWGYRNPLVSALATLFGFRDEFIKAKPKLEHALATGKAFSSTPAAIILIVGSKNVPLSEASAQYALANMMYYAQVKGLGTCLWGNAPIFIDKSKSARRYLKIQPAERIYAALFLGYPAIRFHNKVSGKALPVQWNAS